MHLNSRIIGIIAAAAMVVGMRSGSVSAAPLAACSVLTLAQVRAIIGPTVVVFEPSSEGPTVRGGHTGSSCVYMPPGSAKDWKGASSGFFFLMWGSPATLTAGYNGYLQRHWIARIKGDVLASAMVSAGKKPDVAASKKLLDAVLNKL